MLNTNALYRPYTLW